MFYDQPSTGDAPNSPVDPIVLQVDPGENDYRNFDLLWGDGTRFAEVIATRTAGRSYRAGFEYWSVDRNALVFQDDLVVRFMGDGSWATHAALPPPEGVSFVAPVETNWISVDDDLETGALYEHDSKPLYIRLALGKDGAGAHLTTVRWYRESTKRPEGSIDPSGNYRRVVHLPGGTFWYGDSLSPP
jgi:hypothetical protein